MEIEGEGFRIVGVAGGEPAWEPDDRSATDPLTVLIAQIRQERHGGRRRRLGDLDAREAEFFVPTGAMMRPDEYLSCHTRCSIYTAFRVVTTVSREQARRAGL